MKTFKQFATNVKEDVAANNTAGAAVREPVVKKKDAKKYLRMNRRKMPKVPGC